MITEILLSALLFKEQVEPKRHEPMSINTHPEHSPESDEIPGVLLVLHDKTVVL